MANAHLVGPFPGGAEPEQYDRTRRRALWSMPTGLYLLGSRAGEARNLMTCSLACQVCVEPKLIAVAVEREALSHRLVAEGEAFTLALLSRDDRAAVRKFVKPAVEDAAARHGGGGRLNGFDYLDAPVTGSPVPVIAPVALDCRLERSLELGSHTLFVGEVVDVLLAGVPARDGGADAAEVLEGLAVLRMEDTRMSYGG